MRVEDKRKEETTTFDEVEFGEVFQVINVDPIFRNKYFLQTDDGFVDIQTGEGFYKDTFYDDYELEDDRVKVIVLNAKLVIE